jgi:Tol biopolymer transport system component
MRRLLRRLLGHPAGDATEARWPRGSSAVYALEMSDRRALPGTLRRLSPLGDFGQAMITRCGSRAAYWGVGNADTAHRVWVSPLDGNAGAQCVTQDEGIQGHPYWHPDGLRLVYFASRATAWDPRQQFSPHRAPSNLRWLDTRSGDSHPLTEGPYVDERPAVAPDGRTVVFVSNRSGRLNLWRVDEDGSGLTQLTDGAGPDYRPCISPDGQRLAYFSKARDGSHQVRLCSLATGEELACDWLRGFTWTHGPFWCRDGETLLVHALERGARLPGLWLVNLSRAGVVQLDTPGLLSASHGTLDDAERHLVCDSRKPPGA